MILKRIQAENILKYRQLDISNIPANGQIAVAGRNEAGKTAIGETICFALFGRTFSLKPENLTSAIRWSDFRGSVRLEFTGRDGEDYIVTRHVDNNGKHLASLYAAGEETPLANNPRQVASAVTEVVGFEFQSFVDSFYLAQREMEMPHAKSATVKALIGVDKLESVGKDVHAEMTLSAQAIRALDNEIQEARKQADHVTLDRAQLGRLETARETKAQTVGAIDAEAESLALRAENIGRAVTTFVEAGKSFAESTLRTSYKQWRQRKESFSTGLTAVAETAQQIGDLDNPTALKSTSAAIADFDIGLTEYDKIRDLAELYRQRLTFLTDERRTPGITIGDNVSEEQPTDRRYADRRAAVLTEADKVKKRCKPLLGLAIFGAQSAALSWFAWSVVISAPQSTLGGLVESIVGLSELARQNVLLLLAVAATAVTVVMVMMYNRANRQLRIFDLQMENIDAAAQTAQEEISVIEALEDAAVPDALSALRGVRNGLLNSAVSAFTEGSGAVLVKPDALAEKLTQLREHSGQAKRSMIEAQHRVETMARDRASESEGLREAIADLDRQIDEEKKRWAEVEVLERTMAGLEAKTTELRRDLGIHKLSLQLVEGACRRIYSRFLPELRRFVSKILPHLTEDRYQHLELDDDLRVRVFCNEKNDFVSLTEISNGTHRQLMLCVRLALSQALIASSAKTNQFIFFDEPFAFFDEQRMARAIDVLRRISPQVTQVFLAAQTFKDPSQFDMVINCEVDNDCLVVRGKPKGK